MFSSKMITVMMLEIRNRLFSKTFLILTILIPVFMFGLIGVQALLYSVETDAGTNLIIASPQKSLLDQIETELAKEDIIKEKKYTVTYLEKGGAEIEEFVQSKKGALLDEALTGVLFLPDSSLTDKKIVYYSKAPTNINISSKVLPTLNKVLINEYFKEKSLSAEDIDFARKNIDMEGKRISSAEGIQDESTANAILSFLFAFLLYMSLIFSGQMMMRSIVEEKTSRIVEILLSSVHSQDLIAGKVLGTAITGVAQMAIWLLPVMLVGTTSMFVLPPEFLLQIKLTDIGYLLLNYLLGLTTFLALFAAVGSIFDNEQDSQNGMWPLMMLIIIPFFIALSIQQNPSSPIGRIASMAPFANIIVMPARMTLVEVPMWELALSFVVMLLTMLGCFKIGSKIYRTGIMMTGKKPKWSEVITWLKA